MRIGLLTGGGDCPGLNAVIRAVVRKGVTTYGHEFVGFRDGWRGPLEGETRPLGIQEVRGILPRGGTILGSSRTNPFKIDGGVERIRENLGGFGIDSFSAIINPPQGFILAIGRINKIAVVDDCDQVGVGQRMSICMSCDHRVVDGALGAEYLKELRRLLENPALLLI